MQLRRLETRLRSSGAGNTLQVSIPRNAAAQLKMADNHGRTTQEGIKFHLRYEIMYFYVVLFFYTWEFWGSSFSSFRDLRV